MSDSGNTICIHPISLFLTAFILFSSPESPNHVIERRASCLESLRRSPKYCKEVLRGTRRAGRPPLWVSIALDDGDGTQHTELVFIAEAGYKRSGRLVVVF